MLIVVCCCRLSFLFVGFGCWLLTAVCCSLFCVLAFVVDCLTCVVWSSLFVDCCTFIVVRCSLFVVVFVLVRCSLFVVRCLFLLLRRLTFVGGCSLFVVC